MKGSTMVYGTDKHDRSSGIPMRQDRRTFLRHTFGLGGVSAFGTLAGCALRGEYLKDAGSEGIESYPTTDSSGLRMQVGMEVGLGSTSLTRLAGPSEIDPAKPVGGRWSLLTMLLLVSK